MAKKKLTSRGGFTPPLRKGRGFTPLEMKISNRTDKRFLTGFTLTELVITMMTSTIVISAIGFILADSHRGWNRMYNRVFSDVVTDGYVAKKTFNAVVRKSSTKRLEPEFSDTSEFSEFVEVYYYQDLYSEELDRYAKFYTTATAGELRVDYGVLDTDGSPMTASNTITLARNVEDVSFSVNGTSVQMILELDNGKEALTVTCSAVRHNK